MIVGEAIGTGTGIVPEVAQGENFGELRPGGGLGIVAGDRRVSQDAGQKTPDVGKRERMLGIGEESGEVGSSKFDGCLMHKGRSTFDVEQKRRACEPARLSLGTRKSKMALLVEFKSVLI
jgi:hypothetical protein